MKKKKKEGANKATVDLLGTGTVTGADTSSSSEEQSPFLEPGAARGKRVGFQRLGAARKATAFCYPSLEDIHEGVERMAEGQVREQVHNALTARSNEASPVMQGIVSKHKNCQPGSQERLIADTGCSFPIINSQIVEKHNIKIIPFARKVNIFEASGNSLNLLGSARLFIKIPQVLESQVHLVEAAVLSGNKTDSELLISLDLLIKWNLVPEGFPNTTLNEYFNQLMTNKHFSKQYSSHYSKQAKEFETQSSDDLSENRYKIPDPPKPCQKLKKTCSYL